MPSLPANLPLTDTPLLPRLESPEEKRRHILTVILEDYFHVSPFKRFIDRKQWSRFERRLEVGTQRTLDLLDEFDIRATFFVLGWVAEVAPELVRRVADRGHEIASKGYYHRGIREMGAQFADDLAQAREVLERASGQEIVGYRAAERWMQPSDLHALDVLAQAGYLYDSSIKPSFRAFANEPWRRFVHQHHSGDHQIWEFPLSSVAVLGLNIPVAGGNHFRQFPHAWVRRALARWDRVCPAPLVLYFHTWELDPDQPRITLASPLAKLRQYRGLGRMDAILRDYLGQYRFGGIASYLGRQIQQPTPLPPPALIPITVAPPSAERQLHGAAVRRAASVVVPCFNEESALAYLANALRQLEEEVADRYELQFILVDDGSADGTYRELRRLFDDLPNYTIIQHDQNRGITAAILTGIRASPNEIVCSLDCDCTYDPRELARMIPLLTHGVDLVTASPYHPRGAVRNVQPWRLLLSKSASSLYRVILRQKLHTYTSCFRVYRRRAVLNLDLRDPGYLGIVELVGRLDLQGGQIVEYPTLLEARLLGRSKMKLVKNVLRHLALLTGFLAERLFQRRRAHRTPEHVSLEQSPTSPLSAD